MGSEIIIPENLTFSTVLMYILYIVVILVLPVLVKWGISVMQVWLKAKTSEMENRYAAEKLNRAIEIVAQAVTETTQTFVSSLKAKGEFTKENAEEAFDRARDTATQMMSTEIVAYIEDTYNDFDLWLKSKIEQLVLYNKPMLPPSSVLLEELKEAPAVMDEVSQ